MNVTDIINRARRLAYTNSHQYNDNTAIEDLNIIYKDLTNTITQEVGEDYFFTYITSDTVIGQNEYTLDDPAKGIYVNKIKDAFIRDDRTGEYKRMQQYTKRDWDDKGEDIEGYYIADKSIFISPTPTIEVSEGLKMDVILKPLSLAVGSAETDIRIEPEFHNIIALGMIQYIYQARGLLNEASNALQYYEMAKNEMVAQLTDRTGSPTVGLLPNLDMYE